MNMFISCIIPRQALPTLSLAITQSLCLPNTQRKEVVVSMVYSAGASGGSGADMVKRSRMVVIPDARTQVDE